MRASEAVGLWEPSIAMRRCRADVARAFGLAPAVILGTRRDRLASAARQAAVWVLKARWPKLGHLQLAYLIGVEDHSTVIHALRRARALRETDMVFHYVTEAVLHGRSVERADPPPASLVAALMRPAETLTPEEDQAARDELVGEALFGGVALGSVKLLKALRREFPERMVA